VCRRHAARFGLVLIGVALGVTCIHLRPGAAQVAGSAMPGRAYYLRDCAVCHGSDASGTNAGPSLQGVGRAAVDFWIATGRMPLVKDPARSPSDGVLRPLPEDQLGDPNAPTRRHEPAYPPDVIRALVDYVSAIAPGGPDIPSVSVADANVAEGGDIYRLECASCHSWAGTGGALYQREAPSLGRATATQVAEAVRTGPGQMPKFGPTAIPDDQLADVVAYVRYLDHPEDRGGQSLWHLGPVAEGGISIIVGMGLLLLVARWIGERT
jgi:quinol---cytochrome-c reductase cytochrome c subunit